MPILRSPGGGAWWASWAPGAAQASVDFVTDEGEAFPVAPTLSWFVADLDAAWQAWEALQDDEAPQALLEAEVVGGQQDEQVALRDAGPEAVGRLRVEDVLLLAPPYQLVVDRPHVRVDEGSVLGLRLALAAVAPLELEEGDLVDEGQDRRYGVEL